MKTSTALKAGFLLGFVFSGILVGLVLYWASSRPSTQPEPAAITAPTVSVPEVTDVAEVPPPPVAVTTNPPPTAAAGFQVIVGANPSLGNSTFTPPTNSVVVTNQTQLSQLIERAKAAQKKSVR